MEKTLDYLTHHPVFFVIAVIISVMILFSSLKKIVELLLMVAALVVLYAAWLYLSGGHVPEGFRSIEQFFNHWFHVLGDGATSLLNLFKASKRELL
ncbi:MAG: hypothetical protein FDX02_07380 [Chlorobium sp.]|nr:MAG: hypothetical protein FDX02_07380 [Chlorobium sp.]